MDIRKNVELAPLTSLAVGGQAEELIVADSSSKLKEAIKTNDSYTILGYGCNSLISDKGISGLVIICRGGNIEFEDNVVIADAGVWWDDLVQETIRRELWGLELMSEIPGSVGAAAYINITAYGQSVGENTAWVEAWDKDLQQIVKLGSDDLVWNYKKSIFQDNPNKYVILRVAIQLSTSPSHELTYQKALDVAEEMNLSANSLVDRRKIIIEARIRAGSIWHKNNDNSERTAGSFFRNPVVSSELAAKIISYDESGKTAEQIKNMNLVHGGDEKRVSAAHVMLASGFKRGQSWGTVKLNDKNVLKIETIPGATAQEVYDVMTEVKDKCRSLVGIDLEPEVQLLGDFS